MAELVFRSVRIITHADWLLNGPTFYSPGTSAILFRTGALSFGGKSVVISTKFKENYL